jgi:hypothetical protein
MISRTFSTRRCSWHDYSTPGWYYLEFRTRKGKVIFGDEEQPTADQAECRRKLYEIASAIPDRYPEARVDTLRVLPASAHLLVHVLTHRNQGCCLNFATYDDWWNHRRTMTVPLLAGFFETHSGISINELHGTPGQRVWEGRFGDRILEDEYAATLIRDVLRGDPEGRIATMLMNRNHKRECDTLTSWPMMLDTIVRTRDWIRPYIVDTTEREAYKPPPKIEEEDSPE